MIDAVVGKARELLAAAAGAEAEAKETAAARYERLVRELVAGKTKATPAETHRAASEAGKSLAQLGADVAAGQRIAEAVVAARDLGRLLQERDEAKALLLSSRRERVAALIELAKAERADNASFRAAVEKASHVSQQAQTVLGAGGVGAALLELGQACTVARALEVEAEEEAAAIGEAEHSLRVLRRDKGDWAVIERTQKALDDAKRTAASEKSPKSRHAKALQEVKRLQEKVRRALLETHGLGGADAEALLAGFEATPRARGTGQTGPMGRAPTADKMARTVDLLNEVHVAFVGR